MDKRLIIGFDGKKRFGSTRLDMALDRMVSKRVTLIADRWIDLQVIVSAV